MREKPREPPGRPSPRRHPTLVLAAVILVACTRVGTTGSRATVPPKAEDPDTAAVRIDTEPHCPDTPEQHVLDLVNQRRAAAKMPRLRVDARLVAAAREHAEDMGRSGLFGHVGSDGTSPSDRVRRQGYVFLSVGENLAAGMASADEAVKAWMRSPEHRMNILGGYQQTGIAYVHARFSQYGSYWVQVFGTSLVPSVDPGAVCNP